MANAFTGKDVSKSLLKKGFKEIDGDHHYYWLYIDGKKTSIRTKVSHGKKTYTGNLLNCVKKQLRLDGKQISDFIRCPMSEEDYIKHLQQEGHV